MLVVTYSEARQNFASVLDKSKNEGADLLNGLTVLFFAFLQKLQRYLLLLESKLFLI